MHAEETIERQLAADRSAANGFGVLALILTNCEEGPRLDNNPIGCGNWFGLDLKSTQERFGYIFE